MPSFFNGQRLCLTYSRVREFSLAELLEFLCSLTDVKSVVVCQEEHRCGTPHFHAAVEFEHRIRFKVRSFDLHGRHPNIQPAKNWIAWNRYIRKDGNFVEWSKEPKDEVDEGEEIEVIEDESTEGIPLYDTCKSMSRMQWVQYCYDHKVPAFIFEEVWNSCKVQDSFTIFERPCDVGGRMCSALQSFEYDFCDSKTSLIIVGDTGCGKTTWAIDHAPLPSLFVRHIDVLKKFKSDVHKSIIFDDVQFTHLPRCSQLFLVDQYNAAAIHCRYGVGNIPANIPRIFTCNTGFEPVNLTDPAISRRVKVVRVGNLHF